MFGRLEGVTVVDGVRKITKNGPWLKRRQGLCWKNVVKGKQAKQPEDMAYDHHRHNPSRISISTYAYNIDTYRNRTARSAI
jgi:hypothetical protein